ncbi:MAG: DUF1549 and DUF1553 domain-containing protein [Planctomycetota bacterium]|nr:DUF1549 and DUF1553 domain-containing protein [Planctomycetota bacterium]
MNTTCPLANPTGTKSMGKTVPTARETSDGAHRRLAGALWVVVATVLSASTLSFADSPSTDQAVESLAIFPARIQLDSATDRQQVVAVAHLKNGTTRDVSAEVAWTFSAAGHAAIEDRTIAPIADGSLTLEARFGETSAQAEVLVRNAKAVPPASFRNDVEPILARAGCNAGSCHGSASGKNGFRLSLFGFDPNMDYMHLTRQTRGRRLDIADPAQSLMLLKPTATVAHEGGRRFDRDGEFHDILERWIAEGARNDPSDLPALTKIEILPVQSVLEGKSSTQQMIVRALYADGTDRDVTRLALFSSTDDRAAVIDEAGKVTAGERGESHILARFGPFAVVSQVIVLPEKLDFVWPNPPVRNYVDTLIHQKLKKLRIAPSEACSDEIFIRRVFLDVIGLLPTVAEFDRFMADAASDKRAKLIDGLLQRPEFPKVWAMKWAELLRIESASRRISFKAMYQYNNWIRDAILNDVPVDRMAKTLLTAGGGNFTAPAANFYMVETSPTSMAENVAQVFLGIRIQCAQCHNHPFERWTMDDYYGFAAFFGQVGRKQAEDPRETIVFNRGSGGVRHIRDNRLMAPKFLAGAAPNVAGKDRRKVLAEWLTSRENPWFTKCFVNRVWSHFFGRGIADPPDDVRVSNPPSNPELLDALAEKFVEHDYNLRRLVRDICNSSTYQLATRPNETNKGDERNFSKALIRRVPGEFLLDAICQVTERPEKFRGLPLGAHAVEVADGRTGNYFLDVFGRPDRTSACTCDRRNEPTLVQALHLINGETIDKKIRAEGGRVARLCKNKKAIGEIADELYAAALSRKPTPAELEAAGKRLEEAGDLRRAVEDLFWAVLNSREFVFNH